MLNRAPRNWLSLSEVDGVTHTGPLQILVGSCGTPFLYPPRQPKRTKYFHSVHSLLISFQVPKVVHEAHVCDLSLTSIGASASERLSTCSFFARNPRTPGAHERTPSDSGGSHSFGACNTSSTLKLDVRQQVYLHGESLTNH